MNTRRLTLVPAAVALLGALLGTAAQAHGSDARLSVTISPPVVTIPLPRVMASPIWVLHPVQRSQPPVVAPVHDRGWHYHGEPRRWDVDGDGIPNRYDRVYNPPWDRNGNGVPDRREHRYHHPWGDRDGDGIANRYDRRDDGRHDGRPPQSDWRGPR
jgi:hypothetical protein